MNTVEGYARKCEKEVGHLNKHCIETKYGEVWFVADSEEVTANNRRGRFGSKGMNLRMLIG